MLKHDSDIALNEVDPDTTPVNPPQPTGPVSAAAGIIDAVADQLGGQWVRYGTLARFCWFSVQELMVRRTS